MELAGQGAHALHEGLAVRLVCGNLVQRLVNAPDIAGMDLIFQPAQGLPRMGAVAYRHHAVTLAALTSAGRSATIQSSCSCRPSQSSSSATRTGLTMKSSGVMPTSLSRALSKALADTMAAGAVLRPSARMARRVPQPSRPGMARSMKQCVGM